MSRSIEQAVRLVATRLKDARFTRSRQVESLCPFPHPGRTSRKRTFYISLDTGAWICHYCNRRGRSIQSLAERLGVDTKLTDDDLGLIELHQQRAAREKISDRLPNHLADVFLRHGPIILRDAGFNRDTLLTHKIGMDLELDTFTVPIFSRDGVLRAISGRFLGPLLPDQPKYKFYREKELRGLVDDEVLDSYEPRPHRYLWRENLLPARVDTLVICEGFKAAMWMAQLGYDSVALMGTRPTGEQLRTIRQLEPRRIILALDNDAPGIVGTNATIGKVRHLAKTYVFNYPGQKEDGTSPDDWGQDDIADAVSSALNPIQWRMKNHVTKRYSQP